MSDSLVLHWPLDALAPQKTVLDSGPNQLTGTFVEAPTVVTDPKFACLRLGGGNQYAVVPAGRPLLALTTYTLSAWINWSGGGTTAVFGKQSPNIRLRLESNGCLEHMFNTTRGLDSHSTDAGVIPPNTWKHVAVTHDNTSARIFVDGRLVAEQVRQGVSRVADQEDFCLGWGNATAAYTGLLAQFRVYDRALTAAEILRDMADDEPPLEMFVRSHPLDFAFVNDDDQPVLYIDDVKLQTMTLRLTNSSRGTVEAMPLTGVSSSTYHFALRLRKGTLAAGLTPTLNSTDWAMVPEADGTALYFQWKNARPIPPDGTVSVEVAGLNADGTDGTHGTQLELDYKNIRYSGQTMPLVGTRVQYLDVINHRGLHNIPLDIRLVGGDRVLSDGTTPNKLKLHIANTMRAGKGIPLLKGLPTSTFQISFDAEADSGADADKTPWALTKVGAAGGVGLSVTGTRWSARKRPDKVRTWEITPAADTVLAPGEYIEIDLTNILALPKPGHAPILVEYENIPGYADGSATVMVDRTPLLFTRSSAGVNVAADRIEARFQIVHTPQDANGDALVIGRKSEQNLRLGYDRTYTWIQSHVGLPLAINPLGNTVGIGTGAPEARLHIVHTNQDAGGNALILGPTNQAAHLRLGYHQDYSWIQSGGSKPLLINPRGDAVGIGPVGSPQGKLHVVHVNQDSLGGAVIVGPTDQAHLRIGHHQTYSWIQSGGARPLLINPLGPDQIGFGTPGPLGGKVTIRNDSGHLQLRRDTSQGASGQTLYLELFQENTPGTAVTYPTIRFHHANKFWHRIEGRPEGIAFKDGNIPVDQLIDVIARTFVGQNLRIGGVTIGENELRILQRLAAGQLEFDLYNTKQGEYAYAADYEPRDNDRRYVYTWRQKNRINQGRWRIDFPS
ncbi:LamG domain-containing protein [Streptosporangium sp. NPDC049248]|uniref:LamG domain-containing protein n=1 Tax=Streptosporangium sp. NPDC049248 TaxID=3155651 RepID=UPI003440714A